MFFQNRNSNLLTRKFKDASKFNRTEIFYYLTLKYLFIPPFRIFIGIKKLLDLIDMARYTEPQNRVIKFLTKMEDEGGLSPAH